MKWKSTAMTLLVVLATGASIFIGSRAIVSAASTLKSSSGPEVAASDEFDVAGEQVADLLKDLNHSSGSCFFLGSSEETLARIANNLKNDYPRVNAGYYSPPFKK